MRFTLLPILLLLLVGCASTGIAYHEAPDTDTQSATIYIYRPDKFLLGAYDARLAVDEVITAKLGGGEYTYLYVMEGCHNIQLSWPYYTTFGRKYDIDFCPQAGKSYFIQVDGLNVVSWRLSLVNKSDALPDINSCSYVQSENKGGTKD